MDDLNPIWVRLLGRLQLSNPSGLPCLYTPNQFHIGRAHTQNDRCLLKYLINVGKVISSVDFFPPELCWWSGSISNNMYQCCHDSNLVEYQFSCWYFQCTHPSPPLSPRNGWRRTWSVWSFKARAPSRESPQSGTMRRTSGNKHLATDTWVPLA